MILNCFICSLMCISKCARKSKQCIFRLFVWYYGLFPFVFDWLYNNTPLDMNGNCSHLFCILAHFEHYDYCGAFVTCKISRVVFVCTLTGLCCGNANTNYQWWTTLYTYDWTIYSDSLYTINIFFGHWLYRIRDGCAPSCSVLQVTFNAVWR